ncbi:MAG: YbaB/EbfC family nucleoid-associated protein, partial [Patescibacteria group bacterium]
MQNPLKMLGDLNKMRQQATQIQADLEKQEYTVEKGRIKIVITGNQRIVAAMIDGQNVAELV